MPHLQALEKAEGKRQVMSPNGDTCYFFLIVILRCEILSHCGCDLLIPDDEGYIEHLFHVPLGHLDVFFGKNVVPLLIF